MAKQGKDRIVLAAFNLFLEKGYHGVSIQDISKNSQISKGTIYHHFSSKYDIYVSALEKYFFKVLMPETPKDQKLSIRKRLRNRYENIVDLVDYVEHMGSGISFPARALFILQLEGERDPKVLSRIQQFMDLYRSEMTSIIQEAINSGNIISHLPAKVIAYHIMTMSEGMVVHHSAVEKNLKSFLMTKYDDVIDKYLDLIIIEK